MSQRKVAAGIVLVAVVIGLTGAPALAQTDLPGAEEEQRTKNVAQQGNETNTTTQGDEGETTQDGESETATQDDVVDPANQSMITVDRVEIETLRLVDVRVADLEVNNASGTDVMNATGANSTENGSAAVTLDVLNVSRSVLENVTLRNVTIRDHEVSGALFENATNYTPGEDRELSLEEATLTNVSIQGLVVESLAVNETADVTIPSAATNDETMPGVDEVPPDVTIGEATVGNVTESNATGRNVPAETEETQTEETTAE